MLKILELLIDTCCSNRKLIRIAGDDKPKDVVKLTDQVYHYDVTDQVFEKASSFEDRQKEKFHDRKSVLEKLEEKKQEAKALVGPKNTPCREQYSL